MAATDRLDLVSESARICQEFRQLPLSWLACSFVDFTIEQKVNASIDVVEGLLYDPDFIQACSGLQRISECKLVSKDDLGDGKLKVVIHRKFDADLSGAVKAAVDPDKLTWNEVIDYDLSTHTGETVLDPDHYGDMLSAEIKVTMTEDAGVTTIHNDGKLNVHVILVGRKVEQAIVSGLKEFAEAQTGLLNQWAADR